MSFDLKQFKYGKKSLHNLKTLDKRWQDILNEAIKYFDISILCGYRGEKEQDNAFYSKKSPFQFPLSQHNINPSIAVDLALWPIEWTNIKMFYQLAGCIKTIAKQQGVDIKWSGDWKKFMGSSKNKEYVHFEIIIDK